MAVEREARRFDRRDWFAEERFQLGTAGRERVSLRNAHLIASAALAIASAIVLTARCKVRMPRETYLATSKV